jgi:hypothetical protein
MAAGKYNNIAWDLINNLPTLSKPRTDLIALFIMSILKAGTINLVKIALCMDSQAKASSSYRRIQRFIEQVTWCFGCLIPLILKWSEITESLTLVIDRTNWKLGKCDINILCVAVLGDGFCIPVIWKLLPKRGNSSQDERIDLISRLLNIDGIPKIQRIIGDREFIGSKWFKYLKDNKIDILIRLKDNQKVRRYNKIYRVNQVIEGNSRRGVQCNGNKYWMSQDVQIYIHGFRYKNEENKLENLIVASYTRDVKVDKEYSKRWYIECMFKNFKTNGFNMEDTHVTKTSRLETLFGLLTLGYICAIRAGKIIKREKPELFKIAKNGRPKISTFRAGLNEILNVLTCGLTKRFNLIFKFLSCA